MVILESIVGFQLDFRFTNWVCNLEIVGGLEMGDQFAMGLLEVDFVEDEQDVVAGWIEDQRKEDCGEFKGSHYHWSITLFYNFL